ncbi:Ig-like domain (group 3) [Micromonospora phaseoli]|uniref:Ig-like domain (Group 3) n=1 Tax=Micromonospora phaseoli TaxID=1144548 RepID=A0A1H7DR94_9ACTN|nr:alpha/beta hydrolase-fold protein [Micromonospora phaseoli]PZV90012.1 Ig-like domain-containing protein [Micromonospora phaseoli]SEK03904.1 Ig-like domain (group 3) [Micromonospora phaseoli]
MRKAIGRRRLRRAISLLAIMSLGVGAVASAPAAAAGRPAVAEGATVTADRSSPTGYTVKFVYHNPNATQVRLAGDLTLLDVNTGNTRYQPEEWQPGRYHAGGTEFLRDMTRDSKGNWSVSVPLHAGSLSYWYRVWDPTQGWENKRIWDPASTNPRPPGESSFRVRNNDVLDAVYVPYAKKQNDPVLKERAEYELPMANRSQRGQVQYIPYTTILGDSGHYLGVYLPANYDANRAEPYKVAYLAHGIFGDETDFMVPANVPNILDNMTAKGEIEPTVVVTMGNHFTGTSLGFASYNQTNAANNLVQTILPLIEEKYNVSTERAGRAYAGFSYGGMTGAHVIRGYPTTFAFYGHFSGNPSLTTQDYDNVADAVGDDDLFVFLGNGVFEGNLNAQNAIANNFRARGYAAQTTQVPGAHDGMTASQLFTIFARDHLWSGVDSVSVTPASVQLTRGWNWVRQFNAQVTTNDGVSPAVTWSVKGATSKDTTISAAGLLSVAAAERSSSLTVVATSVVDPTKASSARVTLTPPGTAKTVVKAKAAPASIVRGGTFKLDVDVRAQSRHKKTPKATGEIAVTFGGTTQVVPLTGGSAVVKLPTSGLEAGAYPVHVAYSGDSTYAPAAAVHQKLRVR